MCLKNTHDLVYVVSMEIFDRIYRNTDLHERSFTQVSCRSLGEIICYMPDVLSLGPSCPTFEECFN